MKTRLTFLLPFICLIFGGPFAIADDIAKQKADIAKQKEDFAELKAKAENGDAEAQCQLGRSYKIGFGVIKDDNEAVKWYRKAADQGNVEAQYELATRYQSGGGVNKDLVQAHAWLKICGGEDQNIHNEIKELEAKMTPEQIAEAGKLATELEAKIKSAKDNKK